jgi:hypothetical protein
MYFHYVQFVILGRLLGYFARLEEARFRDVSTAFKESVARFRLIAWFNCISVQLVCQMDFPKYSVVKADHL